MKDPWLIDSTPETGTNNRNYNTGSSEPAFQTATPPEFLRNDVGYDHVDAVSTIN